MDLNRDGLDDANQVNDCLLAKGLSFTACAWRSLWHVLRGLKTLLMCGFFGLLGLADFADQIDIAGMLRTAFGDDAKVGMVIIGMAVLFAWLRFVSNGAVKGTQAARASEAGGRVYDGDEGA
jgi:hypothetical protein